jgi:hypothetical protein
VGVTNPVYDGVYFKKGADSMDESEVYCAPYMMNGNSKAQGHKDRTAGVKNPGYDIKMDPNSMEGSDVYCAPYDMTRDKKSHGTGSSSEEVYLTPITKSDVVFDNSEYITPVAVQTGHGQQEDGMSTDRVNEEIYWEPASKENELYGQLEKRKFRNIAKCDVTDREEIGSGEFGVVEKAMWKMSQNKSIMVAVKTLMNKSGSETDQRVKFLREAAINGQFHHKNVVRQHGVVTVGSPLMLVLEYMEKGDLKKYLVKQRREPRNSYPSDMPSTLLGMCRDVACGMEYLARKQFVHRDLAARNILVDGKLTCKIGDFGMARDVDDNNYYVTEGGKLPLRWCAPETWKYKKFSSASDVWSYGVLLYEIWSLGQRPFDHISNYEMMDKVECGYRLPPPPGCSRPLYHLMIDCWNPDKHDRPSFGNILQKLMASDDTLLKTGHGDDHEGNIGDELEESSNCFMDLQGMYGWK